jgi:xylulokinase
MGRLFCGIDVGTTNLKVLLLEESGETAWVKSVPASHLRDAIGVVTDALQLVSTAERLIIEGCRAVAKGRKLSAISSAGIGEDGMAVDTHLKPFGHAIQWNDRRGEPLAAELARSEAALRHRAIALDYTSTAGKWLWLRRQAPQELNDASHWLTLTDYPLAVWSQAPFMSATLAPRTGCYDVFQRQWVTDLLKAACAPPLPRLFEAGQIVGTMQPGKLVEDGAADVNTLLVAAGHDHPVAASAIRRLEKDARIDSMGTANATYGETRMLTPEARVDDLYVTSPISGRKGAVAVLGVTEFSVTLARHVQNVQHLYKAQCEIRDVVDIDASLRILFTEMAERTKHHWHAMTEAGVLPAPIHATGGWSKCPALMQLRANVFGEAISVVDEPELVALGAALFAAEAAGAAPRFAAADRSHVVEPRKA